MVYVYSKDFNLDLFCSVGFFVCHLGCVFVSWLAASNFVCFVALELFL